MSTTAEKLTYLNTTKQKIKDSINNIGGNITSETPFRQYVAALESIYQSMPKVSGTGTSLSLSPTLKGLMQSTLKGNTLQNGTPTPSSPIPINNVSGNNDIVVCGKNLFDKDNAIDNYRITQTGIPYSDNNYYISPYIKVIPNTQYTKNSPTADAYHRYAFYEDSNTESFIDVSSDNTITTPSNCKYIRFCGAKTEKDTAMVVVGNETPTTYEAYNGTTYPINLPNGMELSKIGTYQDYIYKENDKWYLHKEIGKVVLDGTEADSDYGTGTTGSFTRFGYNPFQNTNLIKTQSDYVSNYFRYLGTIGGDTTEAGISNTAISNLNRLFIFLPTSLVSTISAFKTWLSTHNTIIYYVLATPTNTEITDTTLISQLEAIYNAKSKNGTTNISQTNNDLPFILDVSALLGSGS